MNLKIIGLALALAAPIAANAAEPPAPKTECRCCKKDAEGKMKCCDDMKAGEHGAEHDMSSMDKK